MPRPAWKSIGLVLFPLVVFVAAVALINRASDRGKATAALKNAADTTHRGACIGGGGRPLNMRPYGPTDFREYWQALGDRALGADSGATAACPERRARPDTTAAWTAERRFLQLDLGFPLVYGGALIVALLAAWRAAGRPFRRAGLIAPVVTLMVVDWIENTVQLWQSSVLRSRGPAGLSGGWIWVASGATVVKIALTLACAALLVWLAWKRRAPNFAPERE